MSMHQKRFQRCILKTVDGYKTPGSYSSDQLFETLMSVVAGWFGHESGLQEGQKSSQAMSGDDGLVPVFSIRKPDIACARLCLGISPSNPS